MEPVKVAPTAVSAPPPLLLFVALAAVILVVGLGLVWLAGRRTFGEQWDGLRLGLRGLLQKELKSRSRGWRSTLVLTVYLLALAAGVAGYLSLSTRAGVIAPTIGLNLFSTLANGAIILLAFITPALTTGGISGERERRTYDLLLVTRVSALGLVGGKLLGSLAYVLFLLIAALPAFAIVFLFGGVPPEYLAAVFWVAAVTTISYAALGLLFSVLFRRTLTATVLTYLVVIGLAFVSPSIATVGNFARGQETAGPPPLLSDASPLTALASVLPGDESGSVATLAKGVAFGASPTFVAGGAPANTLGSLGRQVYVVGTDPVSGQPRLLVAWAPWVYHAAFSLLITLFSSLFAAVLVAPANPLTVRRRRRRAALPVVEVT